MPTAAVCVCHLCVGFCTAAGTISTAAGTIASATNAEVIVH